VAPRKHVEKVPQSHVFDVPKACPSHGSRCFRGVQLEINVHSREYLEQATQRRTMQQLVLRPAESSEQLKTTGTWLGENRTHLV